MSKVPPPAPFAKTSGYSAGRAIFRPFILVAEDNPVNSEIVKAMLERIGCTVDTVSTGREAAAAFRQQYDLIFMDCEMPEMDGYEAVRSIRAWEANHTDAGNRSLPVPIIALTASAAEEDRRSCLASGMNDYLRKPVTREELETMLRKWLAPRSPRSPGHRRRKGLPPGSTLGRNDHESRHSGAPLLDSRILRDISGLGGNEEPDILSRVITVYLHTSPKLMDQIRSAAAAGDDSAMRHGAHSLKSSSASLGGHRLAALCGEVEGLGSDPENVRTTPLLNALEAAYRELRAALEAELERAWSLSDPGEDGSEDQGRADRPREESGENHPRSEKPPLVLVVDDDPALRILACATLRRRGYDTREAENGEQAIVFVRLSMPDLVLLDVMMPDIDGFVVCTEVRRTPGGAAIPVLMMTGLDDSLSIRKAYDVGATDFIVKPINWLILSERVRYMLRAHRTREDLFLSESKNRALLDAMPDRMLRLAVDGTVLELKGSAKTPFLDILPEPVGRNIGEMVPPEIYGPMLHGLKEAIGTTATQIFECSRPIEGMACYWEVRIVASGPDEALVIVRDVTKRKEAEEKLVEAEEEQRNTAEQWRTTFDSIKDPIMLLDPDFRIIRANKATGSFLGLLPEKIVGSTCFSLIHGTAGAPHACPFEKMLREEVHGETEIYFSEKDLWLSVTVDPIFDREGRLTGVVHTAKDISERKRAEEKVRESETRYRTLFEFAHEAICIIREGAIIDCNTRALEMFRCSREEMIGALPQAFLPPEMQPDNRPHEAANGQATGTLAGKPLVFEWKLSRLDGDIFDAEVILGTIWIRGEPVILGVIRDITDRKRAEENLNKALAELEKKNEELEKTYGDLKASQRKVIQQEKMASIGQLAAGIAHEINNPMGFITSNLNSLQKYMGRIPEFVRTQSEAIEKLASATVEERVRVAGRVAETRRKLKMDYLMDDSRELIRESLDGADRVKRIVQDLKSFARIDDMGFTPSDINKGLESTLNIVWNELKYKASVRKDYGNIPPAMCNLGQMSQVFMNILVNAAQAIEHYGEITISTWHDSSHVWVSISDTGQGISEANLGRLFEPFFTTKDVGQGTGLGLSIAYDIVKKHNGDIEVTSKPGLGTTFTIRIPIQTT